MYFLIFFLSGLLKGSKRTTYNSITRPPPQWAPIHSNHTGGGEQKNHHQFSILFDGQPSVNSIIKICSPSPLNPTVYILSHSFVTLLLACIKVHLHLKRTCTSLHSSCSSTGLHSRVHLPLLLACTRVHLHWPALQRTCPRFWPALTMSILRRVF